jgi:hypothetical protein
MFYDALLEKFFENSHTSILAHGWNVLNAAKDKSKLNVIEFFDAFGGLQVKFSDNSELLITANENVFLK